MKFIFLITLDMQEKAVVGIARTLAFLFRK